MAAVFLIGSRCVATSGLKNGFPTARKPVVKIYATSSMIGSRSSACFGFASAAAAKIPVALVAELRKRTPAGIMECKEALVAANGDIDAALKILIAKGNIAKAKDGRTAAEGKLGVATEHGKGVVIELNSETDFVSRGQAFTQLVEQISNAILKSDIRPSTNGTSIAVEQVLSLKTAEGKPVSDAISSLVYTTGEKIQLKSANVVERPGGLVGGYSHHGRVASLVELSVDPALQAATPVPAALNQLGFQLAVNVVGYPPLFVSREDVPADWLESKKREDPAVNTEKLMEEVVLLEQTLSNQKSAKAALADVSAQLKANIRLLRFHRFQLSEKK